VDHRFSPFKGRCCLIVRGHELVDRLAQFPRRGKAGPLQGLAGENAKPTLQLIQPGGVGGGVMKMDLGMASQPAIGFGLVGIEVVQDHMQLAVWMLGYHLVHEVQKLSSSTAGIVAGFHLTGGHIQSR